MSTRICPACGKPLPLQTGRGGRRKYCEQCSPSRRRGPALPAARAPIPLAKKRATKGVLGAVTADLTAAGVLHTWAGQVCVVIARRIDADQEPGGALAALVKVLRDIMATAMSLATVEDAPDPLEQIKRRFELRAVEQVPPK